MDLHTASAPAAVPARPSSTGRRWAVLVATAVLVLVVDQLTKWWALETLDDGPIDLVWTLRLRLSFNTGVAFSLAPGMGPIVAVLAAVVVVFLVRSGRSLSTWTGTLGLALVVGGAVGNLTDRLFRGDRPLHGAVIDFIDLQWWPIFNVADAAVVVGALTLAWRALRAEAGEAPAARGADDGRGPDPR